MVDGYHLESHQVPTTQLSRHFIDEFKHGWLARIQAAMSGMHSQSLVIANGSSTMETTSTCGSLVSVLMELEATN